MRVYAHTPVVSQKSSMRSLRQRLRPQAFNCGPCVACAMHFWRIVCMPHMFASRWRSVGGTSGGEIGKDLGAFTVQNHLNMHSFLEVRKEVGVNEITRIGEEKPNNYRL